MKRNKLCQEAATVSPSPSRGAVEQVIDSSKNRSATWDDSVAALRNVSRWDSALEDTKHGGPSSE